MLLSQVVATEERRVTAAFMLGLVVALAYMLYAFLLAEAEASDHKRANAPSSSAEEKAGGKPTARRVRVEYDADSQRG